MQRKKIFIRTDQYRKSFRAAVYLDRGEQTYLLLDRHVDPFSFQRYEWSESPILALQIEYTACYNAVQIVLNRLVHNEKITAKMAKYGWAEWLAANPIPVGIPRTRLSTAFSPLPVSSTSSLFQNTDFGGGQEGAL